MVFEDSPSVLNFVLAVLQLLSYAFASPMSDIEYQGRKFVFEGDPFTITCKRTEFGLPKWTKDGVPVVPEAQNVTLTEDRLDTNVLFMQLHANVSMLSHRGRYKCDPHSVFSHTMEVIPLPDEDESPDRPQVILKTDEPLALHCGHKLDKAFLINWYKDGSRVISDDERIIISGETLSILDPNEYDAGEYLCIVESNGLSYPVADQQQGYAIQVTYPARVDAFPEQIRPIAGRNLSLECKVHGYPVPRVTWFVDDTPREFFEFNNSRITVMDNDDGLPDSVLFIENVNLDDNYVISCIANNKGGYMETFVSIAVRPSMINTNEEIPGRGIILTTGSDLVLQCNTTDDPSLNVVWYKNNLPVNMSDSRISVENSNNSLIILHASESDTGNYMCLARLGDQMHNATITVRTKLRLHMFDSSKNIVHGQNINLHCNVSHGTPPITFQWFKDDQPLNLSDPRIDVHDDKRNFVDAMLTINNSDYNDRAAYMCLASNEISSANTTILIRVKDKYAALWPFLGICVEVAILCTIIFVYEKRRQKPDFDEADADNNTENKTLPDQEEKSQDIRQRK